MAFRNHYQKTPLAFIAIAVGLVLLVMTLPSLFRYTARREFQCIWGIKQMSVGLDAYADDNDQTLPKADTWMDSISAFTGGDKVFHDPQCSAPTEYGYAFSNGASRLKPAKVGHQEAFAILFDSTLTMRNAHSVPSTMPRPGRHGGRDVIGFLDGHARYFSAPALAP